MVGESVALFDEVNVATALHRLAKLQPPGTSGPQSPIVYADQFQALVEAVQRLLDRFEAQAISNTLWGARGPPLWDFPAPARLHGFVPLFHLHARPSPVVSRARAHAGSPRRGRPSRLRARRRRRRRTGRGRPGGAAVPPLLAAGPCGTCPCGVRRAPLAAQLHACMDCASCSRRTAGRAGAAVRPSCSRRAHASIACHRQPASPRYPRVERAPARAWRAR